jgi:hypothetical protein
VAKLTPEPALDHKHVPKQHPAVPSTSSSLLRNALIITGAVLLAGSLFAALTVAAVFTGGFGLLPGLAIAHVTANFVLASAGIGAGAVVAGSGVSYGLFKFWDWLGWGANTRKTGVPPTKPQISVQPAISPSRSSTCLITTGPLSPKPDKSPAGPVMEPSSQPVLALSEQERFDPLFIPTPTTVQGQGTIAANDNKPNSPVPQDGEVAVATNGNNTPSFSLNPTH